VVGPQPQTPAELPTMWKEAICGAGRLLDVLLVAGGQLDCEELASRAGLTSNAGTFGTYLSRLRSNDLISVEGRVVRLADTLAQQWASQPLDPFRPPEFQTRSGLAYIKLTFVQWPRIEMRAAAAGTSPANLPVKATTTPEARAFADRIEAMMPPVRINELLHQVNRATGSRPPSPTCTLAALRRRERADRRHPGGRHQISGFAARRPPATALPERLIWTADAYIRPKT
jgi:hypothetical protein